MEFDVDGSRIGGPVGLKSRMNHHNNEVGRQVNGSRRGENPSINVLKKFSF